MAALIASAPAKIEAQLYFYWWQIQFFRNYRFFNIISLIQEILRLNPLSHWKSLDANSPNAQPYGFLNLASFDNVPEISTLSSWVYVCS